MRTQLSNSIKGAMFALLVSPFIANAQTKVTNLRPYDQTGINVFETPKDTNAIFENVKVNFGAGFTQSFQGLKHENDANNLYKITPGFNTANANLFMDVQLADGIRLNLTSYLSSRHHNETWVKGGYIQFDKLPFKGQIWEDIMKVTTIKVGHMEINYGDQHFRRSDGGQTIYNPFVENYIMDAFATEIGGEVYVAKNGLFGMLGVSNGLIKGNIDSILVVRDANGVITDDSQHKSPSIYGKVGYDTRLNENLRIRVAGSYYHNNSAGKNGNTLYGGDRTGSNYFMVVEPAGSAVTYASNAFSGRFNPGFTKQIDALQLNGFVKAYGLEFFGTYEFAKGRSNAELDKRDATQIAVEGVYRFGKSENLFVGARYNTVKAELAGLTKDVEVNRYSFGAGWFLTKNILLKAEYTNQEYKNFTDAIRKGAKFDGYVIQAVVGF
ncbi:porin [Desertivirga xinjiangensis]|uniref:porin n=1 Tax=Desertivirga xinjiangensis TaxID=539206 RepID=UPI00210D1502|nr:porin [Pedobacter xinjiangensis]